MRATPVLLTFAVLLPLSVSAGEKQPKQEYKEFSRLVHSFIAKQVPKEIEDASGWGGTIPAEPNLPLARLRQYIKVGDKLEMPHGTWRKFKGKLEEPNKNLKIVVKDFKQIDGKNYRIVADVDATVLVAVEVQQWQKGLLLIGTELAVDTNFTAAVVCDINATLNFKKFPPELNIEPKVSELGIEFVDFKVRGGPIIKGEFGDNLRRDLKDGIRSLIKTAEPTIKSQLNQAIADSLKEGKGTISADAIFKAMPK